MKPCLGHFSLGGIMSITEPSTSQSITSRTRVPQLPHIPPHKRFLTLMKRRQRCHWWVQRSNALGIFLLVTWCQSLNHQPANPLLQEQEFCNFLTSPNTECCLQRWCVTAWQISQWNSCVQVQGAGWLPIGSKRLTVSPLLCRILPFSNSIPLHRDRASVGTPSDADFAVILLENGRPVMEEEAPNCICHLLGLVIITQNSSSQLLLIQQMALGNMFQLNFYQCS